MRVTTNEYRLTDDEAREEAAARLAVLTGKSPTGQQKGPRKAWFGAVFFVTLVAMNYLLMRLAGPAQPVAATKVPEFSMSVNLWGLVSCSSTAPLLLLGLLLATRPPGTRHKAPFEDPTQDRWRQALVKGVIFLATGSVVAAMILLHLRADWTLGSGQFVLVQVAPWLIVLVAFLFRLGWVRKNGPTSLGEASSPWRLAHRCVFSDDGVVLSCEEYTMFYHWSHFVSYLETPRLLVLYTRGVLLVMPPKLAFASAEDLMAAKATIQTHIEKGRFMRQAGGFPVLAAAPRPVEPL